MPVIRCNNDKCASFISVIIYTLAAVLIALLLWNVYLNYSTVNNWKLANGRIIGGDYLTFHLTGKEVCQGHWQHVYDWNYAHQKQQSLLSKHDLHEGGLPFIYPPLIAFGFSSLCELSLPTAFLIWTVVSLCLFLSAVTLTTHSLNIPVKGRLSAIFFGIAFYPFSMECLLGGQLASIGLFVYSLLFFLLKKNRDFMAGMVLSLSYYKPPIFLFYLISSIICKRKRLLAGFTLGASILISISIALLGFEEFLMYLHQVSIYRYGGQILSGQSLPIDKGVSITAFIIQLFPSLNNTSQVFAISGTTVCAFILRKRLIKAYHSRQLVCFNLAFALEAALSLCLSVYTIIYDLSILLIVFIILIHSLKRLKEWQLLVIPLISSFYFEFLYRNISIASELNIKITFILVATLTAVLWRMISSPDTA